MPTSTVRWFIADHPRHGQAAAMQSDEAKALRCTLTSYYARHAPDNLANVEGLVARVVGGPPSEVGVLWRSGGGRGVWGVHPGGGGASLGNGRFRSLWSGSNGAGCCHCLGCRACARGRVVDQGGAFGEDPGQVRRPRGAANFRLTGTSRTDRGHAAFHLRGVVQGSDTCHCSGSEEYGRWWGARGAGCRLRRSPRHRRSHLPPDAVAEAGTTVALYVLQLQ